MQAETHQKKDWFVTQVNWDETDPKRAKKRGIYKLDWCVPHQLDSRSKTRAVPILLARTSQTQRKELRNNENGQPEQSHTRRFAAKRHGNLFMGNETTRMYPGRPI